NGEKILIILDDVWGDINFDEIGIPQSDNRKGCRVFVTTRNLQVCNRLGCSRTIQLDLLSEEDAWIMFQRHAGLSKVSTKNLLDRGRKIANECKRLPIAIAAIASSLKGEQRREKWDVALNSLQKHMSIRGVDEDLVDIYKCLKFSYDYLKNRNAEELFLLCSVFEEDAEISTKILTRLGIGVGLFEGGYDKYDNARNLLVVARNKLLDSCLLLKTNEGYVKMHDL
ncbi:CC-NBS-LRR resistance protein, partial [Trifolium pratense]